MKKRKTKKIKDELTFPHYWICDICAHLKGGVWPPGHVATVCVGRCLYCGIDGLTIIPYVDFDWPKDKNLTARCKNSRD
jgi:hypothetical protein